MVREKVEILSCQTCESGNFRNKKQLQPYEINSLIFVNKTDFFKILEFKKNV